MKKLVFIVICIMFLFNFNEVYAKQGCCSHHGGVAGCSSYGRVICSDGWTGSSCGCEPPIIYGCTDSNANNYNSNANKDDGSCTYTIYGCTDSTAINYNSAANTSDGTCKYENEIIEEEEIKYETEYIKENDSTKKEQSGKNGIKAVHYKVISDEKGNVISKEKVSEEIKEEALNEIKVIKSETKKVSKTDNNIDENDSSNENDGTIFGVLYTVFFIITIILYRKKDNKKTIISKIKNMNIFARIILYVLYYLSIIPAIIDFVILLKNKN